jgi:hypothetical protein
MGRHRSNHKAKLNQFKEKQAAKRNAYNKFVGQQREMYAQYQESAIREFVVETIYNNKNELIKLNTEGIWQLNEELVTVGDDGTLYWTVDNNPLVSGLVSLEDYSKFNKELFNEFLPRIQERLKSKQEPASNDGVDNIDFELVEDENFKTNE